ncbi:MAG: WD40 repeat domain-containing protein [Acidobacteriota bacterium]|nr:WD40 repeat domain-containing protein [Acidobacteriota bacterium]
MIRILDGRTGDLLAQCRCHKQKACVVAFSPDGKRLASGHQDGAVRIWRTTSGKEEKCRTIHETSVWSLAFSPDGQDLLAASNEGRVRGWSSTPGRAPKLLCDHSAPVTTVAFSADGSQLLSSAMDSTLRFWDVETGVEIECLPSFSPRWWRIAPDGRITLGRKDGIYFLDDERREILLQPLEQGCEWGDCIGFSADGACIASGHDQGISVFDARSGAIIWRHNWGEAMGPCSAVALSVDGQSVASGHGFRLGALSHLFTVTRDHLPDSSVRIWNLGKGELERVLTGNRGDVRALAFSADGKRVVSADDEFMSLVWDLESGEPIESIDGLVDPTAIADGSRFPLRALVQRRELKIQSAQTARVIARLPISMVGLATHPEGRTWAGFSGEHVILFRLEGWYGDPGQVPSASPATASWPR